MTLYGIREIRNGKIQPLSILAQADLSGDTQDGLSSTKYLEITAAITLTTGRKTLFLSEDLNFVAELFLDGSAIDFEEYFEFERSPFADSYEVYNAFTNEKVDIDINDPMLADAKENIEQKNAERAEM